MPLYTYQHVDTGEILEVAAPMRDAPPNPYRNERGTWRRVYSLSGVVVRAGVASTYKNSPPVARMLPANDAPVVGIKNISGHQVFIHQDGTRSDSKQRRIIETPREYDLNKAALAKKGVTVERD